VEAGLPLRRSPARSAQGSAPRALRLFDRASRQPRSPGLGLDRGGSCHGIAFRVTGGAEEETVAYLRAREQVTDVYVEARRPVRLLDGSGRRVNALCYLCDRNHEQYAGALSLEEQIRIVRAGKGQEGGNVEYVLRTMRHLQELGVTDPLLASLAAHLTELEA
jgi:cation transport protein ChaC